MERIKILVPTDFSIYARNALEFAVGLSEFYNLEIVLFHTMLYNDYSQLVDSNKESKIVDEHKTKALENLCKESDYIKSKNPDIYVKIVLDKGDVELNIINVMNKEDVNYIVMGTQGESGLKDTIFSSYASNILITANCPVFTIPLASHYKKINKILCLTELDDSEIKSIEETIKLARIYESELIIYNAAPKSSEQKNKLSNFKNKLKEISYYPNITFITEQSENILESIENYTCKTNPDLIVTLGERRNLWDRLFSERITKELCLHSKIPLLSFPESV